MENNNNKLLRKIFGENPVLVLFLGACPALAATTDVRAALAMGVSVLLVMLLSDLVFCALKKLIPQRARLAAIVLIVTIFVSVVQLLMNAFLPSVYKMLGVYLAVVALNLLVFNSAESGETVGTALKGSLFTGLAFILILFLMAAVREIFGLGSFAGISLPFFSTYNVPILAKAAGGFIVFAIVLAILNAKMPSKVPASSDLASMQVLGADAPEEKEE